MYVAMWCEKHPGPTGPLELWARFLQIKAKRNRNRLIRLTPIMTGFGLRLT